MLSQKHQIKKTFQNQNQFRVSNFFQPGGKKKKYVSPVRKKI